MWNSTNISTVIPTTLITEEEAFPAAVRYGYIGYYIIIFTLASVGNIFALLTCYKSYRESTSVVLCYIASLSTADLLFTLLTPIDLAVFLTGYWVSGAVLCRLQSFLIESSYTASVLTLAAISHERLLAVSSPLLARSQRIRQRQFLPVVIWGVALLSCVPLLYAYEPVVKDDPPKPQCINKAWGDEGRQIYYSIQGILLFIFPLAYMSYAHCHIFKALSKHTLTRKQIASKLTPSMERNNDVNQRKITKMLAIVTVIFVACYFPFIIFRSLRYFYVYTGDMVWRCVQLLIFTQAAVNPIIYCFCSKQFRGVFKDLLHCRCGVIKGKNTVALRTRSRSSSSTFLSASAIHLHNVNGFAGSHDAAQV